MEHRYEVPEEPAVPAPPQAPPTPQVPEAQTPSSTSGQVQQGAAFAPLGQQQAAGVVADTGWSWGAFIFNFRFLIGIRRYAMAALFLVPLVNVIMIFYMGFKGREMASQSKTFANRDEYIGFMKGVDHAGKVMFFLFLGIFVFVILASVLLASLGVAREKGQAASASDQSYERALQFEQNY